LTGEGAVLLSAFSNLVPQPSATDATVVIQMPCAAVVSSGFMLLFVEINEIVLGRAKSAVRSAACYCKLMKA